ncbi:hypothetical protein R1flu_018066 [Riccia fluitans]|uniref:Uncharacterized protein n=1 Tax=Riccia fluitans TaxID=41844 RepID=A0ABD1ZF00_9MARC
MLLHQSDRTYPPENLTTVTLVRRSRKYTTVHLSSTLWPAKTKVEDFCFSCGRRFRSKIDLLAQRREEEEERPAIKELETEGRGSLLAYRHCHRSRFSHDTPQQKSPESSPLSVLIAALCRMVKQEEVVQTILSQV